MPAACADGHAAREVLALARPDPLKTRVDGLAFECEDGEDAFVDAAEGFAANETLQGLDAEGEFGDGEPLRHFKSG